VVKSQIPIFFEISNHLVVVRFGHRPPTRCYKPSDRTDYNTLRRNWLVLAENTEINIVIVTNLLLISCSISFSHFAFLCSQQKHQVHKYIHVTLIMTPPRGH